MAKIKAVPTKYTLYFSNYEEVEYVFETTLTSEQAIMIQAYITTGLRPDNAGCWQCSAGVMRVLTGKMDAYEYQVAVGLETWPWPLPVKASDTAEELNGKEKA